MKTLIIMSYKDRRDNVPLDCKVYVGNLGSGASRSELEDEFGHFGRLVNVWVARNPPGFAYVEFERSRDAKDAVRSLDGTTLCGRRAKVELSHGQKRNRSSFRPNFNERPRRNMAEVKCYTCNKMGHFARDCRDGDRSRSRSRSPRRRYSRSKSRSYSRSRSRSRSPKYSRSRSRSPENGQKSRSHSRSRSRSWILRAMRTSYTIKPRISTNINLTKCMISIALAFPCCWVNIWKNGQLRAISNLVHIIFAFEKIICVVVNTVYICRISFVPHYRARFLYNSLGIKNLTSYHIFLRCYESMLLQLLKR